MHVPVAGAVRRGALRRLAPALMAAACAAVLLSGCGGDNGPSPQEARVYMKGLDGQDTALKPGTDVNALYADAMSLKGKGDCAHAVPKLRQVAGLGPGYENAQTALGDCLLRGAKDPDLSADNYEGLMWLRRAADAGWAEAQGALAEFQALGPAAARNTDEAAYWLALYLGNPGKARVGFTPLAEDRLAAIKAAIPAAAQAAGETRAQSWQRKVWEPPPGTTTPGPTAQHTRHRSRMNDPDDMPE
jgi:hypothetical protein